jgi:hypothetical protein
MSSGAHWRKKQSDFALNFLQSSLKFPETRNSTADVWLRGADSFT